MSNFALALIATTACIVTGALATLAVALGNLEGARGRNGA